MNKYQKYILGKYGIRSNFIFHRCNPIVENKLVNEGTVQYGEFDIERDSFTIKQDEDINLLEYALVLVNKIDIFSNISICKNDEWTDIALTMENNVPTYKIIVNFNDRIEKIKFDFKNQLADDYILSVCYQEADKEKYYAKKVQERKDDLFKKANIKVSTGANLVNIYFQPCCDNYARTEIVLYKDDIMLAKYKVDEETFFKSISGLAYGKYEFILKQFDDKGNIILETDKIAFSINAPHYGVTPRVNRI
jgi:hypothetical protein